MDDLARWLGEQLDEDERIAREAACLSGGAPAVGKRWRVSGSHSDDGGTYWSVTTASPDLDRVPVVEMVGSGMSGGGAHTEEVATHIAEWDPARVLRETDAKRRTLIRCQEAMSAASPMLVHFAKQTLREMALGFSHRPGYAEAIASVE